MTLIEVRASLLDKASILRLTGPMLLTCKLSANAAAEARRQLLGVG